mmetsp:Transcript_8074/g.18448  ORF Transcript_8074/g.18448 Transcript_8074/m.18448 type:complete len:289 (+) Transcript_8074:337-1203(+)
MLRAAVHERGIRRRAQQLPHLLGRARDKRLGAGPARLELLLDRVLQLSCFCHLPAYVRSSYELRPDVQLRNRRPLGEFLDRLPQAWVALLVQAVDALVVHLELIHESDCSVGEAALRCLARSFHEQDDGVAIDDILDLLGCLFLRRPDVKLNVGLLPPHFRCLLPPYFHLSRVARRGCSIHLDVARYPTRRCSLHVLLGRVFPGHNFHRVELRARKDLQVILDAVVHHSRHCDVLQIAVLVEACVCSLLLPFFRKRSVATIFLVQVERLDVSEWHRLVAALKSRELSG